MNKRNSRRHRPGHISKVVVNIGALSVTNVFRDIVHARGDDTSVEIGDLKADGVGGDVVNAGESRPRGGARRRRGPLRPPARAITHGLAALVNTACAVTAAGVAYALGWA
jgi:hypothetical protein